MVVFGVSTTLYARLDVRLWRTLENSRFLEAPMATLFQVELPALKLTGRVSIPLSVV